VVVSCRQFSCWLLIATLVPASCLAAGDSASRRLRKSQPSTLFHQIQASLSRAAGFLCAFPRDQLRFDAAIGTTAAWQLLPLPDLDCARQQALQVAGKDHDNPLRRFFDPAVHIRRAAVQGWQAPARGRINTNRPVSEALWCDRYPLRSQTLAYITGPMRDRGGFHSTHALWSLVIARQRGCLEHRRFLQLSTDLRRELRRAQAGERAISSTRQIDLFAERALFLALAGEEKDLSTWLGQLLSLQNPDGSFGIRQHGQPHYPEYHATMISSWLLAWWLHRHHGR